MSSQVDPDMYTKPFLLTKTYHRGPYPAIAPENPQNTQKGKIVIITGGGNGIGAAAAKVWARAGAEGIVIVARHIENLQSVSDEIKSINPDIITLLGKADISCGTDVKNLFALVQETFKRPADVLLNVAGYLADGQWIGETSVDAWWKTFEVNLKGSYAMIHHYIQSQPNPREPIGTIITVSGGRAGQTDVGLSGYNISKLAQQRLSEHLQLEYPTLRVFTAMPGIAPTGMITDAFKPFAIDHVDLLGSLALYLVQPRADYLKGSIVSVNWDIEEMEEHKEEIESKKVLQTAWLPVLPIGGGSGISN